MLKIVSRQMGLNVRKNKFDRSLLKSMAFTFTG